MTPRCASLCRVREFAPALDALSPMLSSQAKRDTRNPCRLSTERNVGSYQTVARMAHSAPPKGERRACWARWRQPGSLPMPCWKHAAECHSSALPWLQPPARPSTASRRQCLTERAGWILGGCGKARMGQMILELRFTLEFS